MLRTAAGLCRPAQRLWRLTETTGIPGQLKAQGALLAQHNKNIVALSIRNLSAAYPGMSKEMKSCRQEEEKRILTLVNDLYDPQTPARDHALLPGEKLSGEEVEQVIAFHETEVGKKYLSTNIEIAGPWPQKIIDNYSGRVTALMRDAFCALSRELSGMA